MPTSPVHPTRSAVLFTNVQRNATEFHAHGQNRRSQEHAKVSARTPSSWQSLCPGIHGRMLTPRRGARHSGNVKAVMGKNTPNPFHIAPTCSPTRAPHWLSAIGPTGRESGTCGARSLLLENEVTMGQVFHDAGYATGMFGQWRAWATTTPSGPRVAASARRCATAIDAPPRLRSRRAGRQAVSCEPRQSSPGSQGIGSDWRGEGLGSSRGQLQGGAALDNSPAGNSRMRAVFTTRDGGAVGAYCAYVKKP